MNRYRNAGIRGVHNWHCASTCDHQAGVQPPGGRMKLGEGGGGCQNILSPHFKVCLCSQPGQVRQVVSSTRLDQQVSHTLTPPPRSHEKKEKTLIRPCAHHDRRGCFIQSTDEKPQTQGAHKKDAAFRESGDLKTPRAYRTDGEVIRHP